MESCTYKLKIMPESTLQKINILSLLLFVGILVDTFFFEGALKSSLPHSVSQFWWYYLIFGSPHIIASFVAYANKDYFDYYKKPLIKGLLINSFLIILFLSFIPEMFMYFFIAYTLYHTSWQQFGLCRKYVEDRRLYDIWSKSGVVMAVTLALSVGGESLVTVPTTLSSSLQNIGIVSLAIFTVSTLFLYNKGAHFLTTAYNAITASIAILMGCYVIGIIMIRFTHDISAFCIYIKHDTEEQRAHNKNYLYTLFSKKYARVALILPTVSILVPFLIQRYAGFFGYIAILIISLTHYYLEGIVWKKGTLHRKTLQEY